MAQTVPFSWTQGREVVAWSNPAPAGYWYLDATDPDYALGVQAVYRAVPFWATLDYEYLPTGGAVVVLAAPTDDGQRARLQVWRFADSEDAAAAFVTEIEASDVSGASLGERNGVLDLWYVHDGTLKYRESTDQGDTWSAAQSVAILSVAGNPWAPAESSWSSGGYDSAWPLDHVYDRDGSVILGINGAVSAEILLGDFICRAERNADGDGWEYGRAANITEVSIGNLQPCRSGGAWVLPAGRRIGRLEMNGTYQLHGSTAVTTQRRRGWIDERLGMMLTHRAFVGFSGYRKTAWSCFLPNSAGNGWGLPAEATSSEVSPQLDAFELVQQTSGGLVLARFHTSGFSWRVRRDGSWEVLYLDPDQVPTIKRCKQMPETATGAVFA